MVGKRTINTNRTVTLDELVQIMEEHWDRELYNDFEVISLTDTGIDSCVMLPGTSRYLVLVRPRVAGVFFTKSDMIELAIANAPERETDDGEWPVRKKSSVERRHERIRQIFAASRERRGPTEEVLQRYADHLAQLLGEAGLTA
jgi:hypothetical protein